MDKGYYNEIYLIGVGLFIGLQIFDLFFTYIVVNSGGIFIEGNPFIKSIVSSLPILFTVKLFCICASVEIVEMFKKIRFNNGALALIWLLTGFYVCVMWNNIITVFF